MKPIVFLSHAWNDKALPVFKLVEVKLRKDCDVWVDKEGITPGEHMLTEIEAGIKNADVFVILWSEHAQASKVVQQEIKFAQQYGKFIIPLKIAELDPGVHEAFAGKKYIDLRELHPGVADSNLGLLQLSYHMKKLRIKKAGIQDAALEKEIEDMGAMLRELEDAAFRMQKGVSGNAASSVYMGALIETAQRSVENSEPGEEKNRMSSLLAQLKQVSSEYRGKEDDDRSERKIVDAIAQIDPAGQSELLQLFRNALLQSIAARSGQTAQTQQPEGTIFSPPDNSLAGRMRQYIASVRRQPGSAKVLRDRLLQLVPGMQAAQMAQLEAAIDNYIDAAPALMEGIYFAAGRMQIVPAVEPLLTAATQYFFGANDLVPDHLGTLGLIDDTYVVHLAVHNLNVVYQQNTGVALLNVDLREPAAALRAIIGEPIAAQLDQAVNSTLEQILAQEYYQQLAHWGQTLQVSSNDTAHGPGSWGGSTEDEIARQAALLGISI